jgi:hypothetical protein
MIIRLVLVLVTLLLILSGGFYLVTRDPRYLQFARQVLRFALIFLAIFALLYVLERYVMVGWGVLL